MPRDRKRQRDAHCAPHGSDWWRPRYSSDFVPSRQRALCRLRSGTPRPYSLQEFPQKVGPHGIVRAQERSTEVQPERLAPPEIEDDRARIAAQRRAVVKDTTLLDARDRSRREAFLVVNAAEDRFHERRFRDATVVGRITDHGDVLGLVRTPR
jgi:hypothetical protein